MTRERRLIEHGLPLAEVNVQSGREKSLRHGHISTMHLWWARRPLAMCRAVVAGTLLPDPADDAHRQEVLKDIALAAPFEQSNGAGVRHLRERVAEAWPERRPRVLDCFAGGGAIPLEALRLGADVSASDINPVAHLIQRCILEFPQKYGRSNAHGDRTLNDQFREWAAWVRDRVAKDLESVFPENPTGGRAAVHFWARTMRCHNPACGTEIPLLRDRWLARTSRRIAWLEIRPVNGHLEIEIREGRPPNSIDPSEGTVKSSSVTCPRCSSVVAAKDVRIYGKQSGFGKRLYAVLSVNRHERIYRRPTDLEIAAANDLPAGLLEGLEDTPDGTSAIPDEVMVKSQFRILRNLVYGVDTWAGLFNNRQLYVLATFCAAVRAAYDEMLESGIEPERAKALTTYLGFCVDRIVDRNTAFCGWDTGRETVRSTMPQQAIRMAWHYTEINPLMDVSGNWEGATRWIEQSLNHCVQSSQDTANITRTDAKRLPWPTSYFDAVIVDPPYYDAFQYGDLSDLFYVWLKRSVGHLYPELFATPLTPKAGEIIQTRADKKSPEYITDEEYEHRLQQALEEIRRVVRDDGHVALVFAHTEPSAWERLLNALRAARLLVTTSWPMRSEMSNRSTAQISAVLNSSVVLICRPANLVEDGFYDDVVPELRERVAERLRAFEGLGLHGADYFVSAVGPAFEVFGRYRRVLRLSGEEVGVDELMVLARQTVAHHAMRSLIGGDRLATLDNETLFYLSWRWGYGTDDLPADEAYMLERAFDVDLSTLERIGLVTKSGSSFRLVGPQDRRPPRRGHEMPTTAIGVLHVAARFWEDGRRNELSALLAHTGYSDEPAFWATADALAQVLPEKNPERTMLMGLGSNREALAANAASGSSAEFSSGRLFDLPGDRLTLFD
jgi:putative DNA methylase